MVDVQTKLSLLLSNTHQQHSAANCGLTVNVSPPPIIRNSTVSGALFLLLRKHVLIEASLSKDASSI
jgi:hypothetical protein